MVQLAPSTRVSFQSANKFATHSLAYMLDSLVRVSRRVSWAHFVGIGVSPRAGRGYGRRVQDAGSRGKAGQRCLPDAELTPPHPMTTRRRVSTPPVLRPTPSLLAISSTFNPLFKVLFIFPSRYLFTIGLSLLFSFRWDLPPA